MYYSFVLFWYIPDMQEIRCKGYWYWESGVWSIFANPSFVRHSQDVENMSAEVKVWITQNVTMSWSPARDLTTDKRLFHRSQGTVLYGSNGRANIESAERGKGWGISPQHIQYCMYGNDFCNWSSRLASLFTTTDNFLHRMHGGPLQCKVCIAWVGKICGNKNREVEIERKKLFQAYYDR